MANMIQMNTWLFERLRPFLIQTNGINIGAARWLATDDVDKRWLKNAKIKDVVELGAREVLYYIEFEQGKYIAFPSPFIFETPFCNNIISNSFDGNKLLSNSGLLTILWSNDKFPLRQDARFEHAVTEAFGQEGAIDANDIKNLFVQYDIWELSADYSTINESFLISVYANYLLEQLRQDTSSNFLLLNFSDQTRDIYKAIFESQSCRILGSNLFSSLCSNNWSHSFLELYRCIEYLYQMPYVTQLCDDLKDKSLFPVLYTSLERRLGWRPREDQALLKLLELIGDVDSLEQICLLLGVEKGNFDVAKSKFDLTANSIYALRNSIAHWREALQTNNKRDWDKIIRYLLNIIYDLYEYFKLELNLLTPSVDSVPIRLTEKIIAIETRKGHITTIKYKKVYERCADQNPS